MKRYEGHPGTPGRVLVFSGIGGKGKPLKFRPTHTPATVSWGPSDLSLAWICLAVLDDVLGSSDRSLRLMQRFKWRVGPNWKPGCQWSITEDEIRSIVRDIEQTETATAQSRRIVDMEPKPIVTDRGADVQWDQGQFPKQNLPERKP